MYFDITKVKEYNNAHKIVTFAVLVPDEEDLNGDIITADEVIKTAVDFAKNLAEKKINFDHEAGTETEEAWFVETYILPVELDGLPKGTWMVGIQFSDDLYQKVVDQKIVGVSMEGWGDVETIS